MVVDNEDQNRIAAARWKLLDEGARSYVPANTALIKFRLEVVTTSREVLRGRLPEYSDALGVRLKAEGIVEWSTPSNAWNGIYAGMGVRIEGNSASPPLAGNVAFEVYCGFYWDYQGSDKPWFGTYQGVAFNCRNAADSLQAKFNKIGESAITKNDYDVCLASEFVSEGSQFLDKLGVSLDAWIDAWKRIGGMKGIADPVQ
jgi:hypothetical protein